MPNNPIDIEALFQRVVKLARPQRAAFLDQHCGSDTAARHRLEEMLAEHDPSESNTDSPEETIASDPSLAVTGEHSSAAGESKSSAEPRTTVPGQRGDTQPGAVMAGRYTLREKIGEGGMGEVWVAKQSEPVKRRVALKLIKTGMDSKAVLARFELERQALALMDHPNIARVLDGGLTPAGQPFFVMELVNGLPLDRFCDEQKLSLTERLELFVPICQAVQHAHQKGIVHRDLKPANILVSMVDGRPVPKVIDFGVAKATSGKMTDETMTQWGTVVGTLEYMSPEQTGLSGDDVDTRSDIYSLGVILYELLTGLRPIDKKRMQKADITEMIRIIREEEPAKPSTRLSSVDWLPSLAAVRQTAPSKLTSLLRGELDWVVMKCLEKDRNRRYETANSLARDIQRYLMDEPVEARPPGSGYRIRKFLKRNKGPAIAASLVLLTLVAGIIGTTWGLFEARRQEELAVNQAAATEIARKAALDRAEGERLAKLDADQKRAEAEAEQRIAQSVRDFLQEKLLRQADVTKQANSLLRAGEQSGDTKQNPTILELLDRAAVELAPENIEDSFPGQPKVQAEILQTVGLTYRGIGEFRKAIGLLERALELQRDHSDRDDEKILATMNNLALSYKEAGQLDKAVPLFEETVKLQKAVLSIDAVATLITMKNLAGTLQLAGELKESLALYEETVELQEKLLGAEHHETLFTRTNLAAAYMQSGDRDKAVPLLEATLPLLQAQLGAEHPQTLNTMNVLGQAYMQARQLGKAVTLLEENFKLSTDKLGAAHPQTVTVMGDLAYAYLASGQLNKSLPLSAKTLELRRTQLGDDHPETLTSMNNLAMAYQSARQLDKAIPLFEESLRLIQANLGPAHPRALAVMSNLGSVYQDVEQMGKAVETYKEALRLMRSELSPQHPYTLIGISNLAQAYHTTGDAELAVPLLEESLTLIKAPKDRHSKQAMLAFNLLKLERFEEAERAGRACLATREGLFPDHWVLFNSKVLLARALVGQKKYDEAESLLLAGYKGMREREQTIPAAARVNLTSALESLVGLYEALGDNEKLTEWRAELAAQKGND